MAIAIRAVLALAVVIFAGCAQMGVPAKDDVPPEPKAVAFKPSPAPAAPAGPQQVQASPPAPAASASPAPAPKVHASQPATAAPASAAPQPQMIQREVERTEVVPTKPETFRSLQPFQKFDKGEGEGVARIYKARSKAQVVALLRDRALFAREMRISCERWVQQIAEAHPGIPFEGCEGAAKAIEGDDFQVVACRNEMTMSHNWLVVTNQKGSAFGVWHRTCYTGEMILTWKGGVEVVSTTCFNPLISLTMTKVTKTKVMVPNPAFVPPTKPELPPRGNHPTFRCSGLNCK